MQQLIKFLKHWLLGIIAAIIGLLFGWLVGLWQFLLRVFRNWRRLTELGIGKRGESNATCIPVSGTVYRRPDPLIYSQSFLMSQGLAVTWQNPDVTLLRSGVAVPPTAKLDPDTEYEVVARIWNGSMDAPAIHMPVSFSYLDFGIGGKRVPIGTTSVDLPVRGAPGHPTFAHVKWRTPPIPGHYCLLIELIWGDDANPLNNIGQHNVNIGKLNSPNAKFEFPLRNGAPVARLFRLDADAYRIPPRPVSFPV